MPEGSERTRFATGAFVQRLADSIFSAFMETVSHGGIRWCVMQSSQLYEKPMFAIVFCLPSCRRLRCFLNRGSQFNSGREHQNFINAGMRVATRHRDG